jgi:dTDP-glucose pyrophosphorylase/CBS domain-containing protein
MNDLIARITVPGDATIRKSMEVLDSSGNELILVAKEDGTLLGTISDGDIRRGLLGGLTMQSFADAVMNVKFTAVRQDVGRAEALDLMKAQELRHLPIVSPDGKVVGMHLLRELIGAVERPNWAVVMAGGRGTRLAPLTDTLPKPMIPVAGRPILERIVLHLAGFGVRTIYLSVNYLGHMIEEHFRDGAHLGCRIEYLRETVPLGTGGALSLLPETPQHPLIVMNGDLITQVDIGQFLESHARSGNKLTLGTKEHLYTLPYGVLKTNGNDQIASVAEKPTVKWTVNAGLYVLEPDLLQRVKKDTPFSLPSLIDGCLSVGERVGRYDVDASWLDVGQHAELQKALGRG